MNVLLLGAYGTIGHEIARDLLRHGHSVTGLARDAGFGATLEPNVRWIGADIATLTTPAHWQTHLAGVDGIVNASGALQSGPRDNLGGVQRDAIAALVDAAAACGTIRAFVQISAPGASPSAATEFLRTKGEADAHLRTSALNWVVLKPGLVIAPTAYGGTSLVRALAAFPGVQPVVLPASRIQTVSVADVARATRRALDDPRLGRQDFDLVAPQAESLRDIVLAFRRWLGFRAPSRVIEIPYGIARGVARAADIAGSLGWRAPMRSTALEVLADDVVGDSAPWRAATGETLQTLDETLRDLPATRQERSFARMELLFPSLVVLFSAFWIASGVIGLWQSAAAEAVLAPVTGMALASLAVVGGALLDIAIGVALLIRPLFRKACIAALAVSLLYMTLGALLTPALLADPLGPLLKILPIAGLAAALAAHAEAR